MCGRLACGLEPEDLRKCCFYPQPGCAEPVKPHWRNVDNSGKTYKPSYNICPTEIAPVMVSGRQFSSNIRTIVPMIFGVIPAWSKANEKTKYSTINCRIENVKDSKLYRPLLEKGQRCTVICNGFFEWKKEGTACKKPYFIHSQQSGKVLVDEPQSWNLQIASSFEEEECIFKPLKMAALFEKQVDIDSGKEIFSFTIITLESNSIMSWLHHRMPAIIDTEEQLQVWLDCEKFNGDEALQCLSPHKNVIWYPVSVTVNSTSNKEITCIKSNQKNSKINEMHKGQSNFMTNWLGKRKSSAITEENKSEDIKKRVNSSKKNF